MTPGLKMAAGLHKKKEPDPITIAEFMKKKILDVEYLVKPIIPRVGITIPCGPPKSFKTKFMEFIVLKGERGENIFEYEVDKSFTTLWFDEENGEIDMHNDFRRWFNGLGIDPDKFKSRIKIFSGFKIDAEHMPLFEHYIETYKPDLVVIDSITKVIIGDEDLTGAKEVFALMGPVCEKYKIAIALIHHSPKTSTRNLNALRGSGEFGGMCHSAIYFERVEENAHSGESKFMLKQIARRQGQDSSPINFIITGDDDKLIRNSIFFT